MTKYYLIYNPYNMRGIYYVLDRAPQNEPYVEVTEDFYNLTLDYEYYIEIIDGVAVFPLESHKHKKRETLRLWYEYLAERFPLGDGKYLYGASSIRPPLAIMAYEQMADDEVFQVACCNEESKFRVENDIFTFGSKDEAIATMKEAALFLTKMSNFYFGKLEEVNSCTTPEQVEAVDITPPTF